MSQSTAFSPTPRVGRARKAAASLAVLAACLAAPAVVAAQTQLQASTVEEVVVTANKRTEKLSTVAAAVTAVTSTQLEDAGLVETRDLQGLVPGLTLAGSRGSGSFVLRGIDTGTDNNPVVGAQIDGAPVGPVAAGAGAAFLLPQIDPDVLSQIEVLRGPQGTLYGGSTLGGIVNYVTTRPNLTGVGGSLYAEASGTEHGGANGVVRGAYNLPLVQDQLALQVSGYYDGFSGYINAPALGDKDVNYDHTYGGRIALLWAPTSKLHVQLAETYSGLNSVSDQATFNSDGVPTNGPLATAAKVLPRYDADFYLTSLNVDDDLDWAKLSYIGTYQRADTTFTSDLTSYSLGALAKGVLPVFGGAAVGADAGVGELQPTNFSKVTQEIRLASPETGPLRWIGGLYYGYEDTTAPQNIGAFDNNQALTDSLLYFNLITHLTEVAGFGNVTYQITPKLDVTGGVRIGYIDQDYRQTFAGADAGAYNALLTFSGLPATPADTGTQSSSETFATYLADVRYRFSSDDMVYARFSTGYRPGGPNEAAAGLQTTYAPDTTENYELGWKTDLFSKHAYLDLSLYDIEWDHIQITTVSSTGVGGLTNGGHAVSRGVEATFEAKPIEGLSLTATVAYDDAHLTQNVITPAGVIGLKGDQLPNAPKWMESVSAEYTWPLADRLDGFVGGAVHAVDARYWVPESTTLFPQYQMPSYVTGDLRAGVRSGRTELQVFVRNLGDERAQTANSAYGLNFVTLSRPRTIGAAVSTKF